ncbi:MAG TPA: polysaccharide biosynthesis tyrosine autokinase [Baekduia sp.]|nr:polysaccharide biosynthesis tyrosine autokinase [Baekduia sp.]
MELREYLSVLARRRHIVFAVFLGTLGAAIVVTLLRPATWTATATLRVEPATSLVGGSVQADDVKYLDRLVNTYSRLATSDQMRDRLRSELRLDERPKVEFAQLAGTNLVEMKVTTADRYKAAPATKRAASLLVSEVRTLSGTDARAAERSFTQRAQRLERQKAAAEAELNQLRASGPEGAGSERALVLEEQISGTRQRLSALRDDHERYESTRDANARGVSLISEPTQPHSPDNRNLPLTLAIGFLLAAIAAPAVAFVAENLSRRFRTGDEIEASVGAPVLTAVPLVETMPSRQLFNNRSPAQEAFRRLRTTLLLRSRDEVAGVADRLTLLVTSARPGEGKSTVVANLGRALAESGRSTLLIDADLRVPVLHRFFDLENRRGLSDLLRAAPGLRPEIADLLEPSGVRGLDLLLAGDAVEDPPTLLGSPVAGELFATVAASYDYVIIDSPAVLAVTDALVLTRNAHGVLLVAGSNVQRDALRLAGQQLSRVGATVLGIVVNGADDPGLYPYLDYPYLEGGARMERRPPTIEPTPRF